MKKLTPVLQKFKRMVYICIYNILKTIKPLNAKKVILASNRGKDLGGNLLSIYEALKKEKGYDIRVLTTKKGGFKYNLKLITNMADAKFILIDDFFPLLYPLKIRKNAKFIQVWHAVGAFKKVGFSRLGKIGGPSPTSITHKNYTDVIVSSESIVDNYSEAFQLSREKIHPVGVPRTDFFFDKKKKEKIVNKLYELYPDLKGKKIILFAPTFRGNGKKSAHYPEEYFNIKKIYNNLQDNEILIIKNHPFIKNKVEIDEKYSKKIIDLTDYGDINELLLITDILITDYSSVIFEYALLDKPIIFYTPDFEEYKESRDFYYDFSEYTYGPVCKTFNKLIQAIKNSKVDDNKLKIFKKKFLNMCDGNSTKRFIDVLIKEREQ